MPGDHKKPHALSVPQSAAVRVRFGKSVKFAARVDVTPVGLLTIGAMVSSILLSVAPIILAAARVKSAGIRARRSEL